jgi:hypothetical protein
MTRRSILASRILALAFGVWAASAPALADDKRYGVLFEARLIPSAKIARAKIVLGAGAEHVRHLRFRIDPERHRAFEGDGKVELLEGGTALSWTPSGEGATLRYVFAIDHLRDERSYDARVTGSWALFRGDDLFPTARVRTRKGARSESRLRLLIPEGWSRAVPYPLLSNAVYDVSHADRDFDRPTGWMIAGELGAVRERLGDTHLTVAGPLQHGFRRQDILAFLRILLPHVEAAAGRLPPRLLVVGASDPMWRGGLSGTRSLYLHADRPLISEDGTSPVAHELLHTIMAISAREDSDWIVEGLAELYSLELLRRSGAMAKERADEALADLERRGRRARSLYTSDARGAVTARAVTVLRRLDDLIRKRSEGKHSLDDVLRALVAAREPVTTESFQQQAEAATGLDLASFFRSEVGPRP